MRHARKHFLLYSQEAEIRTYVFHNLIPSRCPEGFPVKITPSSETTRLVVILGVFAQDFIYLHLRLIELRQTHYLTQISSSYGANYS